MDIVSTVAAALHDNLGAELDRLARDCQVVRRERAFTGQSLLLMIVATLLHKPDATWADFRLTAIQLGLEVSAAAVAKRFAAGQPLVDFFRSALEQALRQSVSTGPSCAGLLGRFSAVLVGDATTIALPDDLADLFPGCGGVAGTSRAALKLQVLWDLQTGALVELHVEPGRASDAKSPIATVEPEAGSLLVYDLGYFDLSRFAALDTRGAKYISRLQHGTVVKDRDGVTLDLGSHLRGQTATLVDQEVLLGASDALPCRLIAVRAPDQVVNRRRRQAREKARKKGGRAPSMEYLALLAWSLFVTNSAAEELSWKAVVVLYRARWQIELLFKLWKSDNRLACHRAGASALEVLAVFYAKLLGVLLQHWILVATAGPDPALSLRRAARVLREALKGLLMMRGDRAGLKESLRRLRVLVGKLARISARKNNPSHAQLIDDPDLLDWIAEEVAK